MLIDLNIHGISAYGVPLPLDSGQENEFSALLPFGMANVSKSRKQEYVAGRYCAIQAAKNVGFDLQSVPSAKTREPIWPFGIVGSITHSKQFVISCVSNSEDFLSVGIDAEELMAISMGRDIEKVVATSEELTLLNDKNFQLGITVLFSAKEALYKALFPIVRTFIDFKEVTLVDLDLEEQSFELDLRSTNPALVSYLGLYRGSFKTMGETIVTIVSIPKKSQEGLYVHS